MELKLTDNELFMRLRALEFAREDCVCDSSEEDILKKAAIYLDFLLDTRSSKGHSEDEVRDKILKNLKCLEEVFKYINKDLNENNCESLKEFKHIFG